MVHYRRFLILCVALGGNNGAAAAESCRSNATHIAWSGQRQQQKTTTAGVLLERSRRSERMLHVQSCHVQTREAAEKELYEYLRQHVMQFDLPFLETMGFNEEGTPDGLGFGLIGETISYALQSKIELEYADALPKHIFREYVLNYASTNEARSNWRPLFWKKLRHLVQANDTIDSVVHKLNANIWKLLAPADQEYIIFKAQTTPLIFDPMSIMAFGYASCTGVAILLVNALRTMGVPARLVGTAEWNQQREQGNHNWVEVWKPNTHCDNAKKTNCDNMVNGCGCGQWHFLEPSLSVDPSQPAATVDDLSNDPCNHWFCKPIKFNGNLRNTTLVFAARLEPSHHATYFPIAWEWNNRDVPGEDVSSYYLDRCGKC